MDAKLLQLDGAMRLRCQALLTSLQQDDVGAVKATADNDSIPAMQHTPAERQRQLLAELLDLHRLSKKHQQQQAPQQQQQQVLPQDLSPSTTAAEGGPPLQQQQDDTHAACAVHREQILQSLRMQLDTHALSLAAAVAKSATLLKSCKSLVQPPPPLPSPQDILSYSHQLRYTTFAHAGLVSQPPAPQQAQMLNSTLFHYSQQHAAEAMPTALTGTAASTKPQQPEPQQQPQDVKQGQPPPSAPAASAGTSIPLLPGLPPMPADWKPGDPLPQLPPMPAGWQPGDPLPSFPEGFQLPDNIPAMPAGWKPGDSISLPVASQRRAAAGAATAPTAAAAAPAGAQAMELDVVAAGVPSEQAPVVKAPPAVKPELLSFILNPDLEEADDYSSAGEDSEDF